MLTLFITVGGIHLLASMMPGPDFLYVSSTSAARNRQAALAAVFGITAGVAIWAFIALTGLTVLLHRMAWLQQIIQISGGAFLCWTGLQMMRQAARQEATSGAGPSDSYFRGRHVFFRGLLTNLSNPKVFVYFGSVFSLFTGDDIPYQARWILLVMMVLISFFWFFLVATVFSLPRVKLGYRKWTSKINKMAGVMFTAFGLHLIFSH
ncbi:LysE family transporter [Serratia sp. Tan611]|uniref:LysE family transporter n=1 Tax=Serratia sp. Tan611 TaxID=2773264 RepID=UPI0019345D7D|nr:LysE family transporter [Serratia sp. Tan611]CAE1144060.1 Threonine efflux protein [Serratia sp. Tan611]